MLCDNVSCDGLDFYEENHAEHSVKSGIWMHGMPLNKVYSKNP